MHRWLFYWIPGAPRIPKESEFLEETIDIFWQSFYLAFGQFRERAMMGLA